MRDGCKERRGTSDETDPGERLVIEGSANLCGNGSGREQFVLIHDGPLHDFHQRWITEQVAAHEGEAADEGNA
jgi:hypothetical protein